MTKESAGGQVCRYCGLPLSSGWISASSVQPTDPPDDPYCCFGCRFAASVVSEGGETGEARWTLTRLGIAIFFSMNVMVFTMALWSRDVYLDQPSVSSASATVLYELLRYACLLFTAPVVLLLGGPLVEQTWSSVRRGQITTDWLLLAGILAALVYSVISLITGGSHIYYEVACMVLVAVTLGRWLEATGKLKTTEAIRSLQRLLPENARVIDEAIVRYVPLDRVQTGDVVRVLPGERIPLDGIVERNQASVDQQLLTGESEPELRGPGDAVYAGSLNLDGDISIRVTAPSSAGTLQRLVDVVTKAVTEKGVEQRLADRLTQAFVPLIALAAIGTFVGYWMQSSFHEALMSSLAVVLIACPCALGIATPLAYWAALGTACQHQVVFRRGDALGAMARLGAICFDKTGTLTTGTATVQSVDVQPQAEAVDVVRHAASLAAASSHVLSRAIVRYAGVRESSTPDDFQVSGGQGVAGNLPGTPNRMYLGNLDFLSQSGLQIPDSLDQVIEECRSGNASFCGIGWDGLVQGVFRFREQLRDDARETLEQLRSMGLYVCVLTGDHRQRAADLARQLDIDVHGELLPDDKLAALERLRRQYKSVAMVGDGVNDAPALAAADVGIALGCGADVTREAADVCLLGDELNKIPWAIHWARDARRIVRQNLFWAFVYNLVGVSLAIAGRLNPMVAAVAMVGSSLFVVSNSLRLSQQSAPTDTTEVATTSPLNDASPSAAVTASPSTG